MATNKEVEENMVLNFEVPGGTRHIGELEMTEFQDVTEREKETMRAEGPQQPLRRSSWVRKKNPKYTNLALTEDIETKLKKRNKNRIVLRGSIRNQH